MKRFISGRKYRLEIVNTPFQNKVLFYIKATDKKSKRYSHINNLNCILSLFNVGSNDFLVSESQWFIDKKQAKILAEKISIALESNDFSSYLEKQLDLDRFYGEWENIAAN